MSEGGPGWTLKPLTEIKPSSFGRMKQLEREYGHGDYGDLEKKIPNANDPLFKYVKRHLLPKVIRILVRVNLVFLHFLALMPASVNLFSILPLSREL